MPTVTMLAPDGTTSGEIPEDQVQAATAKGFKPAVSMTSPDGKLGYIPVERQQDALKAGFLPAGPPPDNRSLFQKAKDNFNANTQGANPGDTGLKWMGEELAKGVGGFVRSAAHPIRTIDAMTSHTDPALLGLASMVTSKDSPDGQQIRQQLNAIPKSSVPEVIGNLAAGAAFGEGAGRLVSPVANAIKSGAGRAVLLGKTPEAAYESALKPSTTLSQADRAAVIKTALENEIPVSKAGLEKLTDRIDTLNQAIKDEIAKDPNRPIDPNKVATRANQAKARFANQVVAQPDLDTIESTRQQFLAERGATPGNPAPDMAAADAQAMKQGTYQVLKGKFGEQGSASVEAQKALARGLKEEIATQFPEISKMNAAESRLLDLQPILERAVNRTANHQLIGIGTPVAGAAAKAVTGSGTVGAIASVIKGIVDNPNVKSHLAIAISKGGKIPYATALGRVNAYSAKLAASVAAQQASSTGDNSDQSTTSQP